MKEFKLIDEELDYKELLDDFEIVGNKRKKNKITYLNVASGFDIETTSFYENGEKRACMYAWCFGLNGRICIGRTWQQFDNLLTIISQKYELSEFKRLIIYVHNLEFEFSFMKDRFKWTKIFALSPREVLYAIEERGFEFRCSYKLTNYSLEKVGENCILYPIKKLKGDLDYSLYRHSNTFLTMKEKRYLYHDVLIVMSYIEQCRIQENYKIYNIPLTKTGYVRRYCKHYCFTKNKKYPEAKYIRRDYYDIMKAMTIETDTHYFMLKRALMGGHTHANPLCSLEVLSDVSSYDLTSAYPSVMCSKLFPMTKSYIYEPKDYKDFKSYLDKYCCVFDVIFYNIKSRYDFEHIIPSSKCWILDDGIMDNGKVDNASRLGITITNIDFKYYEKFYKWDSIEIGEFRYYLKAYLPKNFIMSVLHLYKKKTELKGIDDKYLEYMQSKGDLNASFGMSIMDICKPEIIYNDNKEWETLEPNFKELIKKYDKQSDRFLYYLWGIFITSYCRAIIYDAILELKFDYAYSDTDSCKFLHLEKHKAYFDTYNENIRGELLQMCKTYKLNPELIEPKNIKGKKCILGVWDFEGTYKRAKFIRAKCYMVEYEDNHHSFTISGCNKRLAIPYLESIARCYFCDIFDLFDEFMEIPESKTLKNIHSYIDYKQEGILIDYRGVKGKYEEFSSVHIEPTSFTLNLSTNFLNYLLGLRGIL